MGKMKKNVKMLDEIIIKLYPQSNNKVETLSSHTGDCALTKDFALA